MAGNGQNFILRFNLTGFVNSRIIYAENPDGVTERGVFIPIEENGLYEEANTKHVLCEAYVNPCSSYIGNKTHTLRQKFSKAFATKMKGLGYSNPKLGGMWLDTNTSKRMNNETTLSRVKFNQE